MTSREIRTAFLEYFKSKGHVIVGSAPLVMKNDPTLLFTNAGMNQFKDIFLGSAQATYLRVCDTQKCLRVSGKHNDLDEVGIDTYHHTFFEMLGNWSFGDYFKKEAIAWAWELLTGVLGLAAADLYVTIFDGDPLSGLEKDTESEDLWLTITDSTHIIPGTRRDNFWEMGDTGPCGPCSEIHVDLRSAAEKALFPGRELVNTGHPQVVEIWNLVFMQFSRLANGSLEALPERHVDTGMGFERLCMALQKKQSNYDTDIFEPLLRFISAQLNIPYGAGEKTDIAMRVLADHIRAVAFAIADGQLPSNTGAGYVIRRILRRAVRYGYTYLSIREPFLYSLTPVLSEQFTGVFDSLAEQEQFITKVISEEEQSFLHTLDQGISRFEKYAEGKDRIEGKFAFELYDTYGFPVDLTELMAREKGIPVEMDVFERELASQRTRARKAGNVEAGDWVLLRDDAQVFTGYDELEARSHLLRYRKVLQKGTETFQLVFQRTPFYAEGGGQVGDTGWIELEEVKTAVLNTVRENNSVMLITPTLPQVVSTLYTLIVNAGRRLKIEAAHTATHLLQAALRRVLGNHVEQRGSRVDDKGLRFDFSHFSKLSDDELKRVEDIINEKIRANIPQLEQRALSYTEALAEGATALFGEKYGSVVRVITFDPGFSKELCGGTHARATGSLGLLKIVAESAVASGVRRIEALIGAEAFNRFREQEMTLSSVKSSLKATGDVQKAVEGVLTEVSALKNELEKYHSSLAQGEKEKIRSLINSQRPVNLIVLETQLPSQELIKTLSFELKNEIPTLVLVLGAFIGGKPFLSIAVSERLIVQHGFNAATWIKQIAKFIDGGGGGQPFYATSGGKDPMELKKALDEARNLLAPVTTNSQ